MDELKPCPFCGGEAKLHQTTYGNNIAAYVVWCGNRNCDVSPTTRYRRFRKEAIEAWNRRAEDEELEFTRKFIHDNGLEFALTAAWNRRTNNE